MASVKRSEDNLQESFSPPHGSQRSNSVVRLVAVAFCQLSHLRGFSYLVAIAAPRLHTSLLCTFPY